MRKITEDGSFYVGQNKLFIKIWSNKSIPDFFVYDTSKIIRQVSKEYFAISIIGGNYEQIQEQLPFPIEHYSITKDEKENSYFCFYQKDIIYGFDKKGKKILEWSCDIGQGHYVYDIKYQFPNSLWLAFPTGQTVTQISISERKETYVIGTYTHEDKYEPLSFPESIFVKNNHLFIPNMGTGDLYRFDFKTQELVLIQTFKEKIWQYGENEIGKFILTDTGIYEID
jgi:hypothetical protein